MLRTANNLSAIKGIDVYYFIEVVDNTKMDLAYYLTVKSCLISDM